MEEQLIEFETAKLAKKKGFNWKCLGNFHVGRIHGNKYVSSLGLYLQDWNNYKEPNRVGYKGSKPDQGQLTTSAPTQSLLAKWLREIHGISVLVGIEGTLSYEYYISSLYPKASYEGSFIHSLHTYSTYEESLEAGLQVALKLIK